INAEVPAEYIAVIIAELLAIPFFPAVQQIHQIILIKISFIIRIYRNVRRRSSGFCGDTFTCSTNGNIIVGRIAVKVFPVTEKLIGTIFYPLIGTGSIKQQIVIVVKKPVSAII